MSTVEQTKGDDRLLLDSSSWKVLALLAFVIWIAHFFYFGQLGLYEDDYVHVARGLGWGIADLLGYGRVFLTWPQGRPAHFFLPQVASFVSASLGGLPVAYLFAFLIVTLNAFLFYLLLKRTRSESLALTGALAFGLFPADTTQALLVHSFALQTSLTCLLAASLCYLSGRRTTSYLVASMSLLLYESPFVVFFGIPLLKNEWGRPLAKELARHALVLAGIILCVAVIRTIVGEERMVELGAGVAQVPLRIMAAIVIGPAVSLLLFLYGPARVLFQGSVEVWVAFLVCLAVLLWRFRKLETDSLDEIRDVFVSFRSRIFGISANIRISDHYSRIAKLGLAALVLLALAYVVSFTHFPPTATLGRGTSVHLAATFGASIIFGIVCAVLLSAANAFRLRRPAVVILIFYLSLLVSYRFLVQMDFKRSWEYQRWFWTSVVESSPDLADGTVVFILDENLPKTRYIKTNSGADTQVLHQIYRFPKYWANPPFAWVVDRHWTDKVAVNGEGEGLAKGFYNFSLLNFNLILLKMVDGKLARSYEPVTIGTQTLNLKPMEPWANPPWERGPLFKYLADQSEGGFTRGDAS